MESFEDNEVVISGVGGVFPKLKNLEDFKKSLLANEELLSSRWPEGKILEKNLRLYTQTNNVCRGKRY